MESGLLNLRAELIRKKSQIKTCEPPSKIKPLYKDEKSSQKKSRTKKEIAIDNEEALKLEKSRQTLEKKAILYDKIKSGTKVLEDDELNDKFLINFQEKIHNEISEISEFISSKESLCKINLECDSELTETQNNLEYNEKEARPPSEEWVEYTDSFGRSRMCLRQDLEAMSKRDLNGQIENVHKEKWEKIEEDSKIKSNIHYQDVLFDEARSHGTSFMPFSRDEKEREAQQQLLKDIGSQENKIHLTKEALKRKRQKMMEQRLAKVRQKKRLKMGLPVKDVDVLTTPPASDEEDIDSNNQEESNKDKDEAPLNPSDHDSSSNRIDKPIREWDIGKPGVASLMSQKQWIESRRKERECEFAPPSTYDRAKFKGRKKEASDLQSIQGFTLENSFSQSEEKPREFAPPSTYEKAKFKGSKKQWSDSQSVKGFTSENSAAGRSEEKTLEFAPPSTYEYFRPSVSKRTNLPSISVDLETAISKGLAEIRKNLNKNK